MTAALILVLLAQPPAPTLATLRPSPPPEESQAVRAYRVPLELVGGVATGLVAGALGALALCGVGSNCGGDENLTAVAYFLLAAPLGISAGITGVGALFDGDGSYWTSTVGVLGASLLDLIVVSTSRHDLGFGADLGMLALPVIGGIVGYEASSHAHRSRHPALSLAPTITGGAHARYGLALTGHF